MFFIKNNLIKDIIFSKIKINTFDNKNLCTPKVENKIFKENKFNFILIIV